MTREEKEYKVHQIQLRANEAKDRLYRMVTDLQEIGEIRRAKSLMTLIYKIEEWQHK